MKNPTSKIVDMRTNVVRVIYPNSTIPKMFNFNTKDDLWDIMSDASLLYIISDVRIVNQPKYPLEVMDIILEKSTNFQTNIDADVIETIINSIIKYEVRLGVLWTTNDEIIFERKLSGVENSFVILDNLNNLKCSVLMSVMRSPYFKEVRSYMGHNIDRYGISNLQIVLIVNDKKVHFNKIELG